MSVNEQRREAKVERVVDGDTIEVLVELGFGACLRKCLRLKFINAPEMKEDGGDTSKQWLVSRVLGKKVEVITYGKGLDKYDRIEAVIFCEGENINEQMLKLGLAKVYHE